MTRTSCSSTPKVYEFRDQQECINAAFTSIGKTLKTQAAILDKFGVRHTELNRIATWSGWDRNIVDLMHNGFLCKRLNKDNSRNTHRLLPRHGLQ